jgi:hypothetical protein
MLVNFLRANVEVFAWSPSDMPDIPRSTHWISEPVLDP